MTIADTIFDTINDNWGSGGYAGATPAIDTTETQKAHDEATANVIEVRHHTLRETGEQVNDSFVNRRYSLDVYVSSKTSNAQLLLLTNEVEYLLRNTAMTGLQLESIDKDWNVSEWEQGRHSVLLRVRVMALLSSGAVTSAAGVTASMQALLMYGSGNAAYVPCIFEQQSTTVFTTYTGMVSNSGGTDGYSIWKLPLPTVKGSLKLYVGNVRLSLYDADADDYVTQVVLYGLKDDGNTAIVIDNTDRTAAGDYTTTLTATDASSYEAITVQTQFVCTNANDLEVAGVSVNCYYA